ncbi:MAG: helix-turn-helix transcriptional regulator [Coriobacteriales bacterium]|nr:helix-turn-helix transcriptional regulator [Coriobacteriales bacterium]
MSRLTAMPEGLRLLLVEIGYACFIASASKGLRDVAYLSNWTPTVSTLLIVFVNISLVVTLVALSLFFSRKQKIPYRLIGGMGMVLLCLGFLCSLVIPLLDDAHVLLTSICGLMFGMGGAMGFFAWVHIFELEDKNAPYELIAGSLLAGVVSLAITRSDIQPYTPFVGILLALFSLVCLRILAQNTQYFTNDETIIKSDTPQSIQSVVSIPAILKSVWQPALCVGTLGMISIVSRYLVAEQVLDLALIISLVGDIVPCLILLVLFTKPSFTVDITQIYKVLFPIVALLFVLLTFLGDVLVVPVAIISGAAYQFCTMLVILLTVNIGRKLNVPSSIVYGLFYGIQMAVLLLGYPVIPLGRAYFGLTLYPVVAVFAVYMLSMGLLTGLIGKKQGELFQIKHTSGIEPAAETVQNIKVSQPNAEYVQGISGEVAQALPNEFVESANLSARETEILKLLLAGRDTPHIAETLVLSKNTIRTHVKSIYTKFDVHSRQELLDLFENAREAESQDQGNIKESWE